MGKDKTIKVHHHGRHDTGILRYSVGLKDHVKGFLRILAVDLDPATIELGKGIPMV